MKKLTIGITTHAKRRHWLEDLIDTLTHYNKDLEYNIIVVDNASEDDTIDYLESIKLKLNLEYIHNTVNIDDTKAMNQILKEVDSDYFLKLDSDVIFTGHNTIKNAIELLESNKLSVVGPFWNLSLRRRREIYNWEGYEKSKQLFRKAELVLSKINKHLDVSLFLPRGNFMLMRTEHIKNIGMFDEYYEHNAMEYPLIMKLLENGYDYDEYDSKHVIHKPSDELREKTKIRMKK